MTSASPNLYAQRSSQGSGTVVMVHPAEIHVFEVSEERLDKIAAGGDVFIQSLAGACFGASISFCLTWITAHDSISTTYLLVVVALTVIFFLASLFFGARAWQARQALKKEVNALKTRRPVRHVTSPTSVGPTLGELLIPDLPAAYPPRAHPPQRPRPPRRAAPKEE